MPRPMPRSERFPLVSPKSSMLCSPLLQEKLCSKHCRLPSDPSSPKLCNRPSSKAFSRTTHPQRKVSPDASTLIARFHHAHPPPGLRHVHAHPRPMPACHIKCSHHQAVVFFRAALRLPKVMCFCGPHLHGHAAACCCPDGIESLPGSIVPSISGLDIPDVSFKDVSPAADAHLRKVANRVLRLDIA